MKRRRFLGMLMLGLSAVLMCGGAAYAMTSIDVTNHFETGIVDINLKEYQKNGSTEEIWKDNPLIMPGDEVSKIPRIHNDGNDCYVRTKITFRGTQEVNEEDLFGISDTWIKADDGYYYYTKILPHGEEIDFFQGIKIPEDLSKKEEGKKLYVDIQADAIQSRNFKPRFDTATPWGDVEILKCEKEGRYNINSLKQSDTKLFQISYQGDSKKLIKNNEDFFANFPYMMPGDSYSDSVDLKNNGEETIKLYFQSENLDDSELLEKILLKITTTIQGEEKVLYDGNLKATDLSKSIVLGEMPKESTGKFTFEIKVPPELNNKYTIQNSCVKWIFSTEPIQKEEKDTITKSVKTGDSFKTGIYLWTLGGSFTVLSFACSGRNRKEEGTDE